MGSRGKVKGIYMIAVVLVGTLCGALVLYFTRSTSLPEPPTGGAVPSVPMVQGASSDTKPVKKKKSSRKKSNTAVQNSASLAAKKYPSIPSSTAMGVYVGPGRVNIHNDFAQWLGVRVPYTTDYIDYKGGWKKDFIDSKVWLTQPWGNWVNQDSRRRLVLGVPMLQNQNYGQFSRGVAGDFDIYFETLAQELVANGLDNTIIRLGYEANCDTIGPWQATQNPKGYRKLFRHQVAVMRSVPGANFKFDWTVCNGLQNGRALKSFDSFYPGDDVVDIIGMDIYDVKWRDPGASAAKRWKHLRERKLGVNEFLKFAKKHHKYVSYPEWGLYKPGDNFAGGGDNPYFIEKMAGLIHDSKPRYQSYFNLDWGGGVLSDFPRGEQTFKAIFGQAGN